MEDKIKIILNFKNPDEFKHLERQAYNGTLDVSDFPPAEYMYFSELRKIYYAFKFEGLSKEEASRKKNILLRRYHEAVSEHEKYCEVYKEYQGNILRAGTLISEINKAKSIHEIAVLACTAIGLMQGERTFADRMKHKMEDMQ